MEYTAGTADWMEVAVAGILFGAHSQQLCDGNHGMEVEEQSVLEALVGLPLPQLHQCKYNMKGKAITSKTPITPILRIMHTTVKIDQRGVCLYH